MKTKFEGEYKTGLTLIIVGSSILIGILGIMVIVLLVSIAVIGSATQVAVFIGLVVFMSIFIAPTIVTLVLASIERKHKTTKRRVALAVLGIIFGSVIGIIGAIFLLVAKEESPTPPVENKDQEIKA
ncbi:hypothetical protein [Williamsoniiplasma lucivorax]|uniref:Uncharacterized protein n=1 Tax=Williamsoniiplasma lucivorax TaxID=209274 RepID=A0A2S5RFC4_9MOLU|nr:hypothetical protein [Williamsoniiplasma lucivorax]PPE06011.1 hypothetical protein ELUCI_v1c03020 [Williamsoniiplasma lucivorax]